MGKIGNIFDVKTGLENLGHMVAREQALSVLFSRQRRLGSEIKVRMKSNTLLCMKYKCILK